MKTNLLRCFTRSVFGPALALAMLAATAIDSHGEEIPANVCQDNVVPTCEVRAWEVGFEECGPVEDDYVHHGREQEEELCGWVTHDSCPYPRVATRTSSAFEQSIAAAAATACARAGIAVEQIVEPFAMVGPTVSDSIDRVKEFQEWWGDAVNQAQADEYAEFETEPAATEFVFDLDTNRCPVAMSEEVAFVDEDESETTCNFDQQLRTLAEEEPIDVNAAADLEDLGESVLIRITGKELLPDPISIVGAAESQVGASPMIVSIEEAYLPYDLSARDLRVWSVFPLVTEPFCVRSHGPSESRVEPWHADVVSADPAPVVAEVQLEEEVVQVDSPGYTLVGSAECLLDEFLWRATETLEDESFLRWTVPATYGGGIASLACRTTRIAESTAQRLASHWPASEPLPADIGPVQPTAGEQLLTRAGAIEADRQPAERIAEVPAGLLR